MQGQSRACRRVLLKGAAAAALAIGVALGAAAPALSQEREIKVGYMKNPIQDASLDIMDKWAKANNVKLTRIPMAYSVFMEKVTATLTSGADQFDMIWHNDDWGQLWKKWLETTDDVKGIENADQWPLLAFWNDNKKLTTVPMAHTVGTFFYRTDLVKPEEVPKTFAELVTVSQRLQKEGKAKWGYVGGMSMNNTWFSFLWTMWANQCDILHPLFERDNEKLKAAKFELESDFLHKRETLGIEEDCIQRTGAPGFDHRASACLMDSLTVDAAEHAARALLDRIAVAAQ